jgi:hypothetical protein
LNIDIGGWPADPPARDHRMQGAAEIACVSGHVEQLAAGTLLLQMLTQ